MKQIPWAACDVSSVPYRVYTDPEIFRLEQERIFRGPVWSYAGLECELPEPGDYITTYIGAVPVIVSRNEQGAVTALVNRCAHRGAIVRRERRGKANSHACIYHQWTYDLDGRLTGVPYRRGIDGAGGYPADFDPTCHGLPPLRVAVYNRVIFVSFSDAAPPIEDYLGEELCARLKRTFSRPVYLLGYQRQRIRGNWKLIVENVKDAYHGALLHAFNSRFGNFRSTQRGRTTLGGGGLHSLLTTFGMEGEADTAKALAQVQTFKPGINLEDKTSLRYIDEFRDGIVTSIMSIFPNMLSIQGRNRPTIRQVRPKSHNEFELVWTYFGYEGDDEDMRLLRVKQANFLGPGGYVSVEDSEAIELVQKAIEAQEGHGSGVIALGGRTVEDQEHLVTEVAIRGFWQGYRKLMGI